MLSRWASRSAIAPTSGTSAPKASSSWARSSAAASRSRSTASESPLVLPRCSWRAWRAAWLWAAIPAFLRTRFNANEILVSLMLVYVASLMLSLLVHDAWRDPEGFNFPQSKMFADSALLPNLLRGDAAQRRAPAGARRRRRGLALPAQEPRGLPDARRGPRARRGQLRRHLVVAHRVDRHADRRRLRGHRGRRRGRRARSGSCCRSSRPATASPRSSSRSSAGCIRSASCSRACSCRCCTSAASPRR